MAKQNETAKQASDNFNDILDILVIPIRKKLRKEYNRVNLEALNFYKKDKMIPEIVYDNHEENLFNISYDGFKTALKAGYLRVMKTFVKAKWIKKEDIKVFEKSLQKSFDKFALKQAKESAKAMSNTSNNTINWLIEKYTEEEEAKQLNSFTDIIKKALGEAKERSIWRSMVSSLPIIHGGMNKGEDDGVNEAEEQERLMINKIWITRLDNRVRDTHKVMHDVQVPNKAYFEVPRLDGGVDLMKYPSDRNGSIENWINCRCVKYYREAK